VGAWGAQELLTTRFGLRADVVSGRVTDTPAGMRFCTEKLEVPAWNALSDGSRLAEAVLDKLAIAAPTSAGGAG
jgi:hypothetical protein